VDSRDEQADLSDNGRASAYCRLKSATDGSTRALAIPADASSVDCPERHLSVFFGFRSTTHGGAFADHSILIPSTEPRIYRESGIAGYLLASA